MRARYGLHDGIVMDSGLWVPDAGDRAAPLTISDLALYLPNDPAYITLNGSNVSAWNDASGNARHAVQATASKQPAYTASTLAYNNRMSVLFDQTDDALATPNFAVSQPFTFFIVGNAGASATDWKEFVNDKASTQNCTLQTSLIATVRMRSGGVSFDKAPVGTTPRIIAAVFNGASSSNYNGSLTPGNGNAGAGSFNGLIIGNDFTGLTNGLGGPICEFAVYTRALTLAEVTTLLNYASARYGITLT